MKFPKTYMGEFVSFNDFLTIDGPVCFWTMVQEIRDYAKNTELLNA